MMQLEADKFRAAVNLTQDYYNAIEDKLISDPPEKPVAHIFNSPVEEGQPPAAEELPAIQVRTEVPEGQPKPDETYPRLDKYF